MLLLEGCSHAAQSRDVEALTIKPDTLQQVTTAVAQSTLPAADKDAFNAMVDEHRANPRALDGKTVHEIINEEHAYQSGLKMAADERASDAKHRAEMAGLIDVAIVRHQDEDHRIVFTLRVQNKSAKTVKRFDSGLEVHNTAGARIGLAEFRTDRTIGPHTVVTFAQPVTYLRFGEDAGMMRMAQGKPKTIALSVKEIKYGDGSDAGYDD